MASGPYRIAHQQDSAVPVQHTSPLQPPYRRSPRAFPNSTYLYGYPSPTTPQQPNPYYHPSTPDSNTRVNASTASSPTLTAYGFQPSFSPTTSISESVSRPDTYFCVHQGCDENTYVSPSTLKKHDREKHCNRKARCVRCHWEGPRKHRHPPTCNGRLSFSVIEKPGGYACGWCEKRFTDHTSWFKDIVEHQKQGELKSDYGHRVTTLTEPQHHKEFPQAQYKFNPAVMAGSNQFSPSAVEHGASPQLSPLSNAPADPELDMSMSPGSDSNDVSTAFSPSSASEASQTPCEGRMAMMREFDGAFAGGAASDETREDVQPSSFDFDNAPQRDPLLGLGISPPPQCLPQEYTDAASHASRVFLYNNECATPAPPPFQYVNPQFTLSDASSYPDEGEYFVS